MLKHTVEEGLMGSHPDSYTVGRDGSGLDRFYCNFDHNNSKVLHRP